MNPSAAGGSVYPMPKRDTAMARPHDHLLLATAAHARLHEGDHGGGELQEDEEQAVKRAEKSERVKRQPRTRGGTFA